MIYQDAEFGEIIVRRNRLSRYVRFSIATSGRLQMSIPYNTPQKTLKFLVNQQRSNIRKNLPLKDPASQRARDTKKKLLSKKAKAYLPYRVDYFANLYHYSYQKLRFSHANTRWGSCSSNRTISLNIGLMRLPKELQDYVILHELAHLNHMDHSANFWAEVEKHDPNYRLHRQQLKKFSPGV